MRFAHVDVHNTLFSSDGFIAQPLCEVVVVWDWLVNKNEKRMISFSNVQPCVAKKANDGLIDIER